MMATAKDLIKSEPITSTDSKIKRICVNSITLTNFRNYKNITLESSGESVVITGKNGSGKTNLLEAISLLAPGRGLRSAKLMQLLHQPSTSEIGWGVAVEAFSAEGAVVFGTGQQSESLDKRIIKIDGELIKRQAITSNYFSVLWQTPQMDGLFSQGISERRYYFDRVCSNFIAEHASLISKYDYLRRERKKILSLDKVDDLWLGSIERKMAETSLALAANRIEVLEGISIEIESLNPIFPKALLSLKGFAEESLIIGSKPAIEIEDELANMLKSSRLNDVNSGRASYGAHKAELDVIFEPKGVEAAYCSTGEQKALMLSLLLAQAEAIKTKQKRIPILLLDEVVAHLDKQRRNALFDALHDLNSQVWITGTDKASFEGFDKTALRYELGAN